jgi:hypothetical protein
MAVARFLWRGWTGDSISESPHKGDSVRRRAQLGLAGLLLLIGRAPLVAQANCDTTKTDEGKRAVALIEDGLKAIPIATPLVSYTQTRLDPTRVKAIRAALERCRFNDALKLYFGTARDAELPDWVVYVPKNGEARHSLIRGTDSTGVYRSQRYVWAIVFAERPDGWSGPFQRGPERVAQTIAMTRPNEDGVGTRTATQVVPAAGPHLEFRRRLLKYEADPLLAAALKFGASKFLGSFEAAAAKDSNDALPQVSMTQLSSDSNAISLYVGTGRHSLATNAQVVLSLHPGAGREMPGQLRDVYANLVNSAPSVWEFGLSFGMSIALNQKQRRDSVIGATKDTVRVSPPVRPSVLFVTYWNFSPPSLPLNHEAWSLAFGTSATSLLDDLMVGVATTQLKGKIGALAGWVWEKKVDFDPKTTPAVRREKRVGRPYVGIDLRF